MNKSEPCKNCGCDNSECREPSKKQLIAQGKKKCTSCNTIKPEDSFNKQKSECKDCRKLRNSKAYAKRKKNVTKYKTRDELVKEIEELKNKIK